MRHLTGVSLCFDSQGPGWAHEGGYIRMARNVNTCHINDRVRIPTGVSLTAQTKRTRASEFFLSLNITQTLE
jgi:hypothetical protein